MEKTDRSAGIENLTYRDLLDSEQRTILERILGTQDNMLVTGKAGTGKSFLLRALLECSEGKTLPMAPTGVAALNINGVTIHSALGFHNLEGIDVDDISRSTLRLKKEKQSVLLAASRIVIDESSMILSDTFEKMDRILQVICKNGRPFGGKQIILFGDIFQLPPVVKGDEEFELIERFGGVHFFETFSYKQGHFAFVELSMNHRQEDDRPFFEILNRVRSGQASESDIDALNQRVIRGDEPAENGTVRLFPKKKDAESFNNLVLSKINSAEHKFMANVWSRNKQPVGLLEKRFPIAQRLRLKVGAQVMMITNDPQKRWANGSMGVVERIERRELSESSSRQGPIEVMVRFGDKAYAIPKATFTEEEAVERGGSIEYEPVVEVKQFPMVLAWALTIHKSQGLTYDRVTCGLNGCFSPGQAYVALSRCKSLNGLHLTGEVSQADLLVDQDVVDFYERQVSGSAETTGNNQRRKTATEVMIEKYLSLRATGEAEANAMLHRALGREDVAEALCSVAASIMADDELLANRLVCLSESISCLKTCNHINDIDKKVEGGGCS